jgi:hypothetical protein
MALLEKNEEQICEIINFEQDMGVAQGSLKPNSLLIYLHFSCFFSRL